MKNYKEHQDGALVELTLLGNEKAYEELVIRHEKAVKGTAFKVTGNEFFVDSHDFGSPFYDTFYFFLFCAGYKKTPGTVLFQGRISSRYHLALSRVRDSSVTPRQASAAITVGIRCRLLCRAGSSGQSSEMYFAVPPDLSHRPRPL